MVAIGLPQSFYYGWAVKAIREEAELCLKGLQEVCEMVKRGQGFEAGVWLYAHGKRFRNFVGRWPKDSEVRSGSLEQ